MVKNLVKITEFAIEVDENIVDTVENLLKTDSILTNLP